MDQIFDQNYSPNLVSMGRDFIVPLPENYQHRYTLGQLGRDTAGPTEQVRENLFTKALNLGARVTLLQVELREGSALCHVELDEPTEGEIRQARQAAARLLGLTSDSNSFEHHLENQPDLARLVEGRSGLRVLLTAELFEGLCWAIIGQQINLPFAYLLRKRLIELSGQPVTDGLIAHPTAAAVARLDYEELTQRQYSRRKAEYLIDTAQLIESGSLSLEELAKEPAAEAERKLLAVRGLGPWSVNYIMMRAFGFADCVPLGDTGLTTALKRFYQLEERPSPKETLALMEPFAPFRSLATYHLWMSLGEPA